MRVRTTKLRTTCPHCGRENDRQTGAGDTVPKDGDAALCWGCLRLSVYVIAKGKTTLRKPTREEQSKLDSDPEVRTAIDTARTSIWPQQAIRRRERASRDGSA